MEEDKSKQNQKKETKPKEKPDKDVGKLVESGKTLTAEEKQGLRKQKKEEQKLAKLAKVSQKQENAPEEEQKEDKKEKKQKQQQKKEEKKAPHISVIDSQKQNLTNIQHALAAPKVESEDIKEGDGELQSQNSLKTPSTHSKRSRGPSFYQQNLPGSEAKEELQKVGSIKEIALFSRLANFKELSGLKEKYHYLHPKILDLGLRIINEQYTSSNTRCIAMIQALKHFINDFTVPENKSLNRELEEELNKIIQFWQECRPFSTGLENAMRLIKEFVSQLNTKLTPTKQKSMINYKLNYIIQDKIIEADQSIIKKAMELFSDQEEELILILGGVQLLQMIFQEAKENNKRFKVVVADTSPDFEGREMVKRLSNLGIKCIYTMISGVNFLIHKVTKVFIGASSVLSNGAVVAKIGTSIITCMAARHQKPVVVFSETYKFSDKVNLDAINNNEIGDPQKLANNQKACQHGQGTQRSALGDWQKSKSLVLLNLKYDLTPCQNINMIICEFGRIPAISVPVVIRESQRENEENQENILDELDS